MFTVIDNPCFVICSRSQQSVGCSSWQLPRPEADLSQPRMSSDVGASRIWNRLLDAAFDNSDRRKHGMGIVGRKCLKFTEY